MAKITRNQFLGFGAALAGAGVVARSGAGALAASAESGVGLPDSAQVTAGPGVVADLIVVNARVLTVDEAQPRAEAFAVKDGKFIAVGSNADIRNIASSRTRVMDAGGATVLPGFIDCHCHVSGVTELYT
ncbi:MAG: hypothetical protein ACRD96_06815, partial [Bryobacteraceae bacterium]